MRAGFLYAALVFLLTWAGIGLRLPFPLIRVDQFSYFGAPETTRPAPRLYFYLDPLKQSGQYT